MSKPIDPDRSTPASRAPRSGRKPMDPTKYQMDTVPTELVAKIAQMRLEPRPQEVLHPPPLFDERPIIGRLRRLGVWISRRKMWLAIGCLVGLCVVIAVTMMRGGANGDARSEGVRVEPTTTSAITNVTTEPNAPNSRSEVAASASVDERRANVKVAKDSTAERNVPPRDVPAARPSVRATEPPTTPRNTSVPPKQERSREPQTKSPKMPINMIYTAE